jgi:hypothetical protein
MYDYWFTIGSGIMDTGLLVAINAVPPVFNLVDRTISETVGGVTTTLPKNATAGLLVKDPTTNVRLAIWNFLKQSPAVRPFPVPPISILTAGRFCQFLTVAAIGYAANNNLANQAYTAALQGADPGTFSPGFPAFLGACLIDSTLATKVATNNLLDPDVQTAVTQFGIDTSPQSNEWPVLTRFAADGNFVTASGNLLNGATWATGCLDQFLFWVGKNEHAIL